MERPREPEPTAPAGAPSPAPAAAESPEFLALAPELEARMRERRAAARARRVVAAQTALSQDKALARWGPFTLLEELGDGPSAVVFRVEDPASGTPLALKLLRRAAVAGSDVTAQRAAAALRLAPRWTAIQHPSLVRVLGVAEHDQRVGLWMEHVDGVVLAALARDGQPLGVVAALEVGIAVAEALVALHGAGLLHTNITARNVMLREGQGAVLMEPGLAPQGGAGKSDRELALSGSPQYLAPELLAGGLPTLASDVYSLGVVLYQCVARAFPVPGPMVRQLREAHARGQRVSLAQRRPELATAFTAVIDRATALDPAQRLADAPALLAALRTAGDELRARGRAGPATAGAHAHRRHRGLWWVGLTVLGLFVLFWLRARGAR